MDRMEKNNSDTFHHDGVTGRKRKAETVVDKLSDEHIYPPCPPAVKGKGALQNSPTVKKTKTLLKKQTRQSLPVCDLDMDVDIPCRVEKRTYGNPEADRIEQDQHKKTRTTGRPVKKSETTTSKQNTKNVKKLHSKSKRVRKVEKAFAKQQHVGKPSSHKKKEPTVSVEEVMRHDQRHDDDTKNTATSSQPVQSDTDDKNENDEYVYRVLRIGEPYEEGIYPKDLNSKVRLEEHVLRGGLPGRSSRKSRFVSCCKTIDGVYELAIRTNKENYTRDVVKINKSKLPKEVFVIDLTDNDTRNQHLHDSTALRYAQMYEEVILEPKICIPSECFEKIGEIRGKKFFSTNGH